MVSTPNDSSLDAGRGLISHVASRLRGIPRFAMSYIAELIPKGLYARTLIIIIAPIVMLEGVIAYTFLERHWQAVTRHLSEATARDIGALVELYKTYERTDDYKQLTELAHGRLRILMQVLPAGELPKEQPKPFFSLLDRTLSNEIRDKVRGRDFWIDTVGRSKHVEIKIKMDDAVLRFITRRSQTYAQNSHIFLIWMVGTSIILLSVSILFLRNQIRPILNLAEAADAFGKGRSTAAELKPRGAREVRQATNAFLEMQDRITQHVDQRTAMLAGVSHDLRTVLTRFKLQLALIGDGSPEMDALQSDVRDMEHMLEDYLAFTKGDGGEEAIAVELPELLQEVQEAFTVLGKPVELRVRKRHREMVVPIRRHAFKRALSNLVSNAARFGEHVLIKATRERSTIRIDVEDDGPGIPLEERDNVFKPFYRIDSARNQVQGCSGLGLAIARDITRSHGGDITLSSSTMGGLRASIRLPI